MPHLLDTHYHLDFLSGAADYRAFLKAAVAAGIEVVAQTLTPSAFVRLRNELQSVTETGASLPRCALGFHPWFIENDAHADAELQVFAGAVRQTRFIGEIGLDFAPARLSATPAALQQRVLREVLTAVGDASAQANERAPYVLSIHAVRAASDVLDLLDAAGTWDQHVAPVFHWFSGTSDELTRLIRSGGFISVNPRMLASKRGRAYVAQVPADRLLLESDLPDAPIAADTSDASQDAVVREISHLRESLHQTRTTLQGLCGPDVLDQINATSTKLFDMPS
ncbi:TatD family hydrolase [Gulosibacter bifidus]|uniref:TatD family hydrolase n=1 Tax=Gulosibacter bifidus TaxID=272239 RepID=A0ABW5RHJ7_9MICO|nr:TatD family hydrolase [Gulosibacter bifidus]